MDLSFTLEEEAFRLEVRTFIQTRLDPATHQAMAEGRVPTKAQVVAWHRALNARGWAAPAWPVEHGGPGWTPVQRMIFLDELHQAPAPEPVSFNVAMIGPVLIRFGTPEQQARFLAPTANLDIWWCQGFSEPEAGSDLADLRTRAERDGDHYVVNGRKIWLGMAHNADWGFFLVRTDPAASSRQAGISFLLIDMSAPRVVVRPIVTLDGRHEINEVFLDDVRVPVGNRIGPENGGWTVAKALLSSERANIARIGMTKHMLRRGKVMRAGDQAFARKAAVIEAELKVLEITQLRILDGQRRSGGADPLASVLKLKGVELRQAASELLLSAVGAAGLRAGAADPDLEPDAAMTIAPNYFSLRAASIYGGASEVQKTIIAKTLLGL